MVKTAQLGCLKPWHKEPPMRFTLLKQQKQGASLWLAETAGETPLPEASELQKVLDDFALGSEVAQVGLSAFTLYLPLESTPLSRAMLGERLTQRIEALGL